MKFNRIAAGHYATEDGCYAVVSDGFGYVSNEQRDGEGLLAGVTGQEWAAVGSSTGGLREDHNAGENLGWYNTKREAVVACEDHNRKQMSLRPMPGETAAEAVERVTKAARRDNRFA